MLRFFYNSLSSSLFIRILIFLKYSIQLSETRILFGIFSQKKINFSTSSYASLLPSLTAVWNRPPLSPISVVLAPAVFMSLSILSVHFFFFLSLILRLFTDSYSHCLRITCLHITRPNRLNLVSFILSTINATTIYTVSCNELIYYSNLLSSLHTSILVCSYPPFDFVLLSTATQRSDPLWMGINRL